MDIFREVDVVLAPATPYPAPRFGEETVTVDGTTVVARANMGIFTQPFSFVELPAVVVPVRNPGELPIGVQIVAAPWNVTAAHRVAAALQAGGVVNAAVP
jgi:aspartyl-tRNA(Asn)/glutamyl-tRNA(Gln) amidotransferase subunit A